MADKPTRSDQAAALRRQAEKVARENTIESQENEEILSPDETRKMLHELRVHQIELEMQNEELRRSQVELETARARYFDFYDLTPVGFFSLNDKGLILEANLTAAGWLGTARSALVMKPINLFIFKEDQDIFYLHNKHLFKTYEPQKYELRMLRADATQFWAHLAATFVRDTDGVPVCRIVVSDITERKNAEEDLRKTSEDLARSNKDLEGFAYAASHDLQEPLRTVASFVDLLAKKYGRQLDSEAMEYIQFAVSGAKRMQKLISDLLAFSRVANAKENFSSVYLESTLKIVKQSLYMAIEETNATITHDPLPDVLGDPVQLQQLLQNLIGNAIKFRKPDEAPRIHIGVEKKDDGIILFSVKDNGIGFNQEQADRIFLIFQRLHSIGAYEGSGVGLTICKRIVERHGGSIYAESEPGKGSTFYFTLKAS